MGLGALRRHRHLPAAAALLSVLLYTALVASHIVSQATHRALPGAPSADVQSVAVDDSDCHDSLPLAGKANPNHDVPAPPQRKCPFCAGYAALHISVAGGAIGVLLADAAPHQVGSLGSAELIWSTSLPSWRSRAPPTLG
jgi:hypothetical protein